jgi:glycosyltransferase involved in cell wall biosynthesis
MDEDASTTSDPAKALDQDGRDAGYRTALPGLHPMPLDPLPENPLVTVLITNYNYGRFIGEALESVSTQTYRRLEIVVCDDGSTDDSCDVVQGAAARDARIRLICQANAGQAAAFNAAYGASSGDVLCFLDADDLYVPHKVQTVLDTFRRDRSGLLVHHMMIVDADRNEVQRIPTFTRLESGWIGQRVIRRGGRWRWMPTSGMCLRRELAEAVFPVPEEPFRIDADTFILELAPLLARVVGVEEILGLYRLHGANAYSRVRVDSSSIGRTIRSISTAVDQVNERLERLEVEPVRLDAGRNVELTEQRFLADALGGSASRGNLARRYVKMMRTVVGDDLYGAGQKLWAAILYGVVVILPTRLRARWASGSLGISHAKERLRRIREGARTSYRGA